MDYPRALEWLYRRQRFGIKMDLEGIRALLDELGRPEGGLPAFHITGSNGKGSVAAFVASCLQAAGHKTGLYTSPHLVSFCERIQVQGEAIAQEDVGSLVARVKRAVEALEARRIVPTFFETVTAMAFLHFQMVKVDAAVIEVGLGGRLDATNVCKPVASVITNIGLEHTDRLGTSLQAIAREKAGILREGVPAVTAARREALDVVAQEAKRVKAPLKVVRRPESVEETLEGTRFKLNYKGEPIDVQTRLLGMHQAENAALALACLESQSKFAIDRNQVTQGLANASWPGRLEIVDRDPIALLDGAHNAPAMETLADFLGRQFPDGDVAACIGILRDKAASKMLDTLASRVRRIIVTQPANERAIGANELGRLVPEGPVVSIVEEPGQALRELYQGGNERCKLVTGSLFLVGEARAQFLRLPRDPAPGAAILQ